MSRRKTKIDIAPEIMRLNYLRNVQKWPMWKLEALYRAAKRTGFFRDPKMMMALRWHVELRRKQVDPVIPLRRAA